MSARDDDQDVTLPPVAARGESAQTSLHVHCDFPQIADLEFLSLIGQGGSASVFKAREKTMDRIVAVKVFHTVNDAASLRRFESEVKLTFAISHPNVVTILKYGKSADGSAYMVLEYLEGESLAARLSRGPLSVEEFRLVFVSLLSALKELHKVGIAHRDVKPANIFLCANSQTETVVKLLDMGIAKDHSDAMAVTLDGALLGSPSYMSPEQCAGGKVDGRSDLYSLACVMYESLAGKPLFAGQSALDTMLKQTTVRAPGTVSLCNLTGAPTRLARCLLKCLNKKPEDRYPDAESLLTDLKAILRSADAFVPGANKRKLPNWRHVVCISLICGIAGSASALRFAQTGAAPVQPTPMLASVETLFTQSADLGVGGEYMKAIEVLEEARRHCHGGRVRTAKVLSSLSHNYYQAACNSTVDAQLRNQLIEKCATTANESIELCIASSGDMDSGVLASSISTLLITTFVRRGPGAFWSSYGQLEKIPRFQTGRGLEGLLDGAGQAAVRFLPCDPRSMQIVEKLLELHKSYGDAFADVLFDLLRLSKLKYFQDHRDESLKIDAQVLECLNDIEYPLLQTTRRDIAIVLANNYVEFKRFDEAEKVLAEHLSKCKAEYQNDRLIMLDFYKSRAEIAVGRKRWNDACRYYQEALKFEGNRNPYLNSLLVQNLDKARRMAVQRNGS